MTKRFYYTCLIKAAYMAKEFGVKFETTVTSYKNFDELDNNKGKKEKRIIFNVGEILLGEIDGEKLYVAQEAEHIFKPKECDLSINKIEIVMRGNKHFFMPEIETDSN